VVGAGGVAGVAELRLQHAVVLLDVLQAAPRSCHLRLLLLQRRLRAGARRSVDAWTEGGQPKVIARTGRLMGALVDAQHRREGMGMHGRMGRESVSSGGNSQMYVQGMKQQRCCTVRHSVCRLREVPAAYCLLARSQRTTAAAALHACRSVAWAAPWSCRAPAAARPAGRWQLAARPWPCCTWPAPHAPAGQVQDASRCAPAGSGAQAIASAVTTPVWRLSAATACGGKAPVSSLTAAYNHAQGYGSSAHVLAHSCPAARAT
jgi:hypothetical protein